MLQRQRAVQRIVKSDGVARGLFRGSFITLLREAQAYGMWFLSYEFMMRQAIRVQHKERKDITTPWLLLFGAAAGDILWLASYPLDVIKSKIQSDRFGPNSTYGGKIGPVIKEITAKEGWRGFWRGIGPALVRAIPCSAATFTTVEYVLRWLG